MISISPHGAGPVGAAQPGSAGEASLRHPGKWLDAAQELSVFSNARSALWTCLRRLSLNRSDEVCIHTTSNGPYISSCVTRTIESVCVWSRRITSNTKLVLVIHEFGFPCDEYRMHTLRCLGIPLLEDCAYAVGSRLAGAAVGRHGDFAIYSLPKYFPVPRGGLLASVEAGFGNDTFEMASGQQLSESDSEDMLAAISCEPAVIHDWNRVRIDHWNHVAQRLAGLGVVPYFVLADGAVPGAFVCTLPRTLDGGRLKNSFVDAGIEATEYYGHGGFYFPLHQFLRDDQIDLMVGLFGGQQ